MSPARGDSLELQATGNDSRSAPVDRRAVADRPVEIHAPAECRIMFIQGAGMEFAGSDGDGGRNRFVRRSSEAGEDQSLAGGVIDRPRFDNLAVLDCRT